LPLQRVFGIQAPMTKPILGILLLLPINGVLAAQPCSLSVGIVPRTGLIYRTWTNALETNVLEGEKGLKVCQDDDVVNELPESNIVCDSEFRLQLLYYPDQVTRNLSVFKRGKRVFSMDAPGYRMSQKIMRSLPTCAELEKL